LFLQVAPDLTMRANIETSLRQLPFVSDLHHLHLWSLDGEQHVLTVHLRLQSDSDSAQLIAFKQQIQQQLQPFHLTHTTVEFEMPMEACRDHG
jgi:cobalt-zinc-cadmium efflux system protein